MIGAFSHISAAELEEASPMVGKADLTVLCSFPIGPGNESNLELVGRASNGILKKSCPLVHCRGDQGDSTKGQCRTQSFEKGEALAEKEKRKEKYRQDIHDTTQGERHRAAGLLQGQNDEGPQEDGAQAHHGGQNELAGRRPGSNYGL